MPASSPDFPSLGYQGTHSDNLDISNHTVASGVPASAAHTPLRISSASCPLNDSIRTASLSTDEQQRMQQYNHSLSGRNIQQSGPSSPGDFPGPDCGVGMLLGGNDLGVVSVTTRSFPVAWPGFQGVAPPSMLKTGTSSMAVMPSPINVHPRVRSGQGNSMLRPQDALHMMQADQKLEPQRQMMVPELQMHFMQGNPQGVPPFIGLSSAFSNQTAPSLVQSYPLHQQQQQMSPQQPHVLSSPHHPQFQGKKHALSTQHKAYAIHFAKERQLQQRLLQKQHQHHQQLAASNAPVPNIKSQSGLPTSPSFQNNSPIQSQPSALLPQPSSLNNLSQYHQKLHIPPHGLSAPTQTGGSELASQMGKQRQQPQQQQSFQLSGRQHSQQQKQSLSQRQANLLITGVGRANIQTHQNLATDTSCLIGLSATLGSQSAEKAEHAKPLMQGKGLCSAAGPNPVQKIYSGQAIPSLQVQQMSHSDDSDQGQAAKSHQAVLPLGVASSTHQLSQSPQKTENQTLPPLQRVFQQNRQSNSDPPSKLQGGPVQNNQQTMSNAYQMRTIMVPCQPFSDKTDVVSLVSSSNSQWKAPAQIYDSCMRNPVMQLVPTDGPPLINSTRSEPMPTVNQGIGLEQSSGRLPSLGHDSGARWPPQQSPLQLPSTPLPLPPQQ